MAPELIGKILVRSWTLEDGSWKRNDGIITEVEAYRVEEDLASHARFGRTKRNEIMYGEAGFVYTYLIYGMYWLLNIVTGRTEEPQAILIRGVNDIKGPGRVGKWLQLDKIFYREDLIHSRRIWIAEPDPDIPNTTSICQSHRVGVGYAGEWAMKPWRWELVGF